VWSVNWSDVRERLDDKAPPSGVPLGGPAGDALRNLLAKVDRTHSDSWLRLYGGSSFDLLIYLLTGGREAAWEKFAQVTLLHLMHRDVRQGASPDVLDSRLRHPTLPSDWATENRNAQPAECIYRTLARDDLNALVCLPLVDAQAWKLESISATLRLMDDRAGELGTAWKPAWREFLRMSNVLQFTPGAIWITTLGLREGLYGGLLEEVVPTTHVAPSPINTLAAEILDPDARAIAIAAYEAGRAPEPGYEIADVAGEIVAMAELAWPAQRVCLMTMAQSEYAEAARAFGWTVFVGQVSWHVVAATLDKSL
jgi:DEAD/DEAH box helicase domain-containing protein